MTRNLLCVTLGKADLVFPEKMDGAGWHLEITRNLASAKKKIRSGDFSVGLFVADEIGDVACAEAEDFLETQNMLEWVGAFPQEFIDSRRGNEIIFNYFFDFHTLPVDFDRLLCTVGHAHGVNSLRRKLILANKTAAEEMFVGSSQAIKKLLRDIGKIASVDAPVMVSGASGSGKELAAKSIHRLSRRAGAPFIAVNCSALPGSLIQSELFGYEKGAFSGASRSKQGFIEAAAGGTIFLDEIGDVPIDLQTNLLRFLQEKTINRVGSTQLLHVDARVIAASHINLEEAVAHGHFREDLYYRLNVLPLQVPSLDERKEDILPLAENFYAIYEKERSPRLRGFSTSAINAMYSHDWPGNVRELLNRVRRALVMAEGRLITSRDMGFEQFSALEEQLVLADARALAEKKTIQLCLSNAKNNLTHAARELGVSRMTLYRLLEKHSIEN